MTACIPVVHPYTGKTVLLHPDFVATGIWLPAVDDDAGWKALSDEVLLDIIPDERLVHLLLLK